MVKRTDKIIADEKNKRRISNIIDYASKPPSKTELEFSNNDNIIISLADAYENKRARQVFEWETIRRKSFQQAA